ncbi:Chitin synthase, class 7 [Kappamyces sp. JEL0829]|nr:Chitin synthase, class 7 [Kappamyces sp. JEL0829]KAJ3359620.1 Chitin synthase, class 7 [Kappamyces sp. JEL0680]
MSTSPSFTFGSFDYFCNQIPLALCPLVGGPNGEGMESQCYSRNIDINGFLVFEPAVLIMHLITLAMTVIMIAHVRFKYTAVGRKEILLFFYLYVALTVVEFLTISGIIPLSSSVYPYFTAIHTSLVVTLFWCLFFNGFVPFQFVEDGTPLSMWALRISCIVVWCISFLISILTFKNAGGLSAAAPGALFALYFIVPLAFVTVYFGLQVVMVTTTLEDRWPIVDILLAAAFFIAGEVFAFALSNQTCGLAQHYLDGMFFSTIFNLLAVMMVYKFWDSITKEDLEFSVGIKSHTWEIKDPLLSDAAMANMQNAMLDYGSTQPAL